MWTVPSVRLARGQRPHPPVFGQPADLITAPGRLGLSPPDTPLNIRAAFCYGVAGRETPSAMAVATTRFSGRAFQRARGDADPRDRARLCGLEPDGAGAHRVRAVAVAAPEWEAEGSGVPGVPGAARRGWCAGAAGQAPGPRDGFGHSRSPDGGGGAGAAAARQRARCRPPAGRAGARARPAPAVPGAGGTLPLPRAHGPVRRPPALSGVCIEAGAGGGRLSAVPQPGVAHGGPGPLGRLGRRDSGAESPARGQQQPVPVAAVGRGEEPRQRGPGARPRAVGGGLAAPLQARALARGDAGGPPSPPRGFVPRRQLGRVGRHQRSRSHGPVRPPCRGGAQDGPGLSCGPGCTAAVAGELGTSINAARGRPPVRSRGPTVSSARSRRVHERHLETIFGTVQVERVGYARAGHESLHPLDAALNLPGERYSLEVRRRVAEAAASRSFDEALLDLSRSTGAEVPKRQRNSWWFGRLRTSTPTRRAVQRMASRRPRGRLSC